MAAAEAGVYAYDGAFADIRDSEGFLRRARQWEMLMSLSPVLFLVVVVPGMQDAVHRNARRD